MHETRYPLHPRWTEPRDRDWIALSILTSDGALFDQSTLRRICDQMELDHVIDEVGSLMELRVRLRAGRYDLIFVDDRLLEGADISALCALAARGASVLAEIIVVGRGLDPAIIAAAKAGELEYFATDRLTPGRLRNAVSAALDRRANAWAASAQSLDMTMRCRTALERACTGLSGALEALEPDARAALVPVLDQLCVDAAEIRTRMTGPD